MHTLMQEFDIIFLAGLQSLKIVKFTIILRLVSCLFTGMNYLHERDIFHRNLKSSNGNPIFTCMLLVMKKVMNRLFRHINACLQFLLL